MRKVLIVIVALATVGISGLLIYEAYQAGYVQSALR